MAAGERVRSPALVPDREALLTRHLPGTLQADRLFDIAVAVISQLIPFSRQDSLEAGVDATNGS